MKLQAMTILLASKAGFFITGQVITMDGGVTIASRGVNKIENNNSNKFFWLFFFQTEANNEDIKVNVC